MIAILVKREGGLEGGKAGNGCAVRGIFGLVGYYPTSTRVSPSDRLS